MHLIICIDDRDGVSFCGRRLSQDRELNRHILELTDGHELWMSSYSAKLFSDCNVRIDDAFQYKAGMGDYCFLETDAILNAYEHLESVVLYHWNRTYPSTQKFPRTLLANMRLVHTEEFSGSSHEKITMERFVP